MQGKVLFALGIAGLLMTFVYLRSMGPRCGDDRCDRGDFCLINEAGDVEDYLCESLPDDCGYWPGCSCFELPQGYDCDDNIWGYVTVTAEPI